MFIMILCIYEDATSIHNGSHGPLILAMVNAPYRLQFHLSKIPFYKGLFIILFVYIV